MSLQNIELYEAVVSNQQLFLRRGNPLCTWWLYFKKGDLVLPWVDGMRYRLHGGSRHHPKPDTWLIIWPGDPLCFFLRQQDPPHQSGKQSQLFHARFKLAVWLKVASPFFPPCPTLLASAARKETNIAHWIRPHYIASRQRGHGLPSFQRFRCSS